MLADEIDAYFLKINAESPALSSPFAEAVKNLLDEGVSFETPTSDEIKVVAEVLYEFYPDFELTGPDNGKVTARSLGLRDFSR